MRRSIVRWTVALLALTVVSAIFSRYGVPSLPFAAAQPGSAQFGDQNSLGRRSNEVLIDDVSQVAAPTRAVAKRAKPVEVASIKLGRQPNPRMIKSLAEPTSIEFVEAPLPDVVEYIKDLHNIEVQIDTKAIEDAAVGPCTPVTCNLKGIALGPALDLLLKNLGLAYVVDDNVLLITHEGTLRAQLVVRLYDCAWLKPDRLRDVTDVIELVSSGRTLRSPAVESADGDRHSGQEMAFRVIPFGSWLAVRANEIEHESVRRLLAELRSAVESEKTAPAAKGKAAKEIEGKP